MILHSVLFLEILLGLRRFSITRQARARLDCGVKDISGSLTGEINRILRTQG